MRKNIFERILKDLLIFLTVAAFLGLTACGQKTTELQPMSFEFALTDQDVEDALAIAEQLEAYIDDGRHFKIIAASEQLQEKQDYILHQYTVSKMNYYCDLADDETYDLYIYGEEAYMTVSEESQRVLKKLYQSDLKAKKRVFEDWSEQRLKGLEVSDEAVIAIEKEQKELMREYLTLENPESEEWSAALEEIYFRFVDSAQRLALFYGYDNYYDYAADEIYLRGYSKEQRQAFRTNVKEYIMPFWAEIDSLYQEKRDQLTEAQEEQLSSLRNDTCLQSDEIFSGYVGSYPEEMKTVMNYLFDRDAVVYSESENAYETAFANYSDYCDQPYVFLGNDCQDILTLVHELGHYAAFYHFEEDELRYDTAEVHSQGNEWLFLHYLEGEVDPGVYETFFLWRMLRGLDIIVLGTVLDEYEETVYNMESISSPDEFRTILSEVVAEYKGIEDILSADELYVCAQYVTMESPVYYLSYATSELAAMSFYTVAEEEGYEAAQEKYVSLCLDTPVDNTFSDTLMDVGLWDPFERDTVLRMIEAFETVFSEEAAMDAA